VAPDALPRVFDRFYRAGTHAHPSGSGLGLAIVAAIAASHGGEVDAALNDPHGLRVTLALPAAAVHERLPDPAGSQA
jgi:signal transduction histidine kinase